MDNLKQKADILHGLLYVEVRYATQGDGASAMVINSQPPLIRNEGYELINHIFTRPQGRQVLLLEGQFGSRYFGLHNQNKAVLVGPFCIQQTDYSLSMKEVFENSNLTTDQLDLLESYLLNRPIFEPQVMKHWAQVVGSLIVNDLVDLETQPEPKEKEVKPLPISESAVKFAENQEVINGYIQEKKILSAITHGDLETVEALMLNAFADEHIPNRVQHALHDLKYMAITMNSLSTRAAFNSGVNPQIVDFLSNRYVKAIERQDNLNDLKALIKGIPANYCQNVIRYSLNQYSTIVRRAITLIRLNIQSTLSLRDIASELNVTKEHLARQFRKETGLTVSRYTNQLKIEEALPFLGTEQGNIDNLAEQFGFCSAAYFRKVFKEVMGVTPGKYHASNK